MVTRQEADRVRRKIKVVDAQIEKLRSVVNGRDVRELVRHEARRQLPKLEVKKVLLEAELDALVGSPIGSTSTRAAS